MPCYSPLQAFFADEAKSKVAFSDTAAREFHEGTDLSDLVFKDVFQLPCGKCMGCRLERSRQWATRCMHEASLYDDNIFITLTYDDEHLPKDGSLNKEHFQLFIKRLRKKYGDGIRYFHCGEYGEKLGRPHYHALLFNFDFPAFRQVSGVIEPDKEFWKMENGLPLYTSRSLTSLWGNGFCCIGAVTFESAAYVARYCTKLITGQMASEHYQGKCPEYATMSRRPGIGRGWFDKYQLDIFPSDFLIVNGAKTKPPRYYDNLFVERAPDEFQRIRDIRMERSKRSSKDQTHRRLKDREKCQEVRFKQLHRQLEFV